MVDLSAVEAKSEASSGHDKAKEVSPAEEKDSSLVEEGPSIHSV